MPVMYCVYLTIYKGNKLPCFYIGSTSVSKIKNGYRGSVSSKEYKNLWKYEQKCNPKLFKTIIISLHETRESALDKENIFHIKLKVTTNPLYLNKAHAIPKGVFGRDNSGSSNPMYGKKRKDAKVRMTENNPMLSASSISRMVASKARLREESKHKSAINRPETLRITSNRMRNENPSNTKCSCITCHKVTNLSGISRYHKFCERTYDLKTHRQNQ